MESFLPWIVLLVPLISAALILLATLRFRTLSSFISVAAVLISFVGSCIIFTTPNMTAPEIAWLDFRPLFFQLLLQQ